MRTRLHLLAEFSLQSRVFAWPESDVAKSPGKLHACGPFWPTGRRWGGVEWFNSSSEADRAESWDEERVGGTQNRPCLPQFFCPERRT